jgi:glyoxylase-like metal-dependent hydrolase (beta-lactamase superfamily II)
MSAWTDVADGIRVRQSKLYRMNSGVLDIDGHAVLVDPGVLPSELRDLADSVDARSVTIVLTHHHWDHVLGLAPWPQAETIAHDRLAAAIDLGSIQAEAAKHTKEQGEHYVEPLAAFEPTRPISGQCFTRLGPWPAVIRDAPGHADTQLTVHFPEEGLFFAADMLSDIEIPMLEGGDGHSRGAVGAYRDTLESLRPLFVGGAVHTLVPGHGAIANGQEACERLDRDVKYLSAIEDGIAACIRKGVSVEETERRLSDMDYTGKTAGYSMQPSHLQNIRIAHTQATRRGSHAS